MPVYAIGDRTPSIDPAAFVHPDAVIIGDVTIGPESTVWPTAVLRGDHGSVRVGARTSIQDGTVVHCTAELPTVIGDDCVVGHNAHLEGAVVEDRCLIGSGSVVLHRVVVRSATKHRSSTIGRIRIASGNAAATPDGRSAPRSTRSGSPAR